MGGWRELAFPIESLSDVELVIDDERADVVTDPLRWRILETLGDGKSVAEISRALGVTDARVLYHVKRLAQTSATLLEHEDEAPQKRRCRPLVGKIRVHDRSPPNDAHTEAIPSDVSSDFNQAFREVAEGLYGASRVVARSHNRARLSKEQAAEFTRRLLALIEDYFPPGKGDRSGVKYGFYGVITPIDLHPLADSANNR